MSEEVSKWLVNGYNLYTCKWGILGLYPTDPNNLLTSWDIQVQTGQQNVGWEFGRNLGMESSPGLRE